MQAEKRLVGHTGRSARLHLRHALGRLGLHLVARPLWGILRCALCLQSLSVEDAIVTKAAVGERLRVVLESIGRRVGSGIVHREQLILLHQHKLNVGSSALDRAGLHISRNSQALGESAIAHLVQLADRNVVALAVLHAGVREITKQQKNHNRGRAEFEIGFTLAGHTKPPTEAICRSYITLRAAAPRIKIAAEVAGGGGVLIWFWFHKFAVPVEATIGLPMRDEWEDFLSLEMNDGDFVLNDDRKVGVFKAAAFFCIPQVIEGKRESVVDSHVARYPLCFLNSRFICRNPIKIGELAFCNDLPS